jgi:hypothetical protein
VGRHGVKHHVASAAVGLFSLAEVLRLRLAELRNPAGECSRENILTHEELVSRFRIEVPGDEGFMLFVPFRRPGRAPLAHVLVSAFMAWK